MYNTPAILYYSVMANRICTRYGQKNLHSVGRIGEVFLALGLSTKFFDPPRIWGRPSAYQSSWALGDCRPRGAFFVAHYPGQHGDRSRLRMQSTRTFGLFCLPLPGKARGCPFCHRQKRINSLFPLPGKHGVWSAWLIWISPTVPARSRSL